MKDFQKGLASYGCWHHVFNESREGCSLSNWFKMHLIWGSWLEVFEHSYHISLLFFLIFNINSSWLCVKIKAPKLETWKQEATINVCVSPRRAAKIRPYWLKLLVNYTNDFAIWCAKHRWSIRSCSEILGRTSMANHPFPIHGKALASGPHCN